MYRSFDEDVLLCPDSVVADVVASAAFDDDLELHDSVAVEPSWCAHVAELSADASGCGPRVDETQSIGGEATRVDTGSRRAHAASGFGG